MNEDVSITKILLLASNPKEMTKLRLEEEARDIEEGLRRAKDRDRFLFKSRWAVCPEDIRRGILDFSPNVVHFSGHGVEEDGGLIFENEAGQAQPVSPKALSGLFRLFSKHVRCVVLNACYSKIQADAIAQHINFVVGMQREIKDRSAIAFSVGFYDALGASRSIEEAYDFGCNAIHLKGLEEQHIPILKKRKYLRDAPNTDSHNATIQNKKETASRVAVITSTIEYNLVLSGRLEEADKQTVEAIVSHLRKLTKDTQLTIKKVERGSIKLTLEGSERGFNKLTTLFDSGELDQIAGFNVQSIRRKEDSPYTQLNNAFLAILSADKPHPTFISVALALRQYRLESNYDPEYVLNEAYLRAITGIERGRMISNYPGWIRLTSRHIVQELSRSKQKKEAALNIVEQESIPAPYVPEEVLTEDYWRIREALASLTQFEQDVLRLNVVRGMDWSSIRRVLIDVGYSPVSTNRLSQIKKQSLRKLRKAYETMSIS